MHAVHQNFYPAGNYCFHVLQTLESDIQAHQDRIDDIMAQVRDFRDANHFMIDRIEDRGRELVSK